LKRDRSSLLPALTAGAILKSVKQPLRQVVIITVAMSLFGCASTPTLHKTVEAQLIDWLANSGADTNLVISLKQLPPSVRKPYHGYYSSGVADRGENFNAGCVRDPEVPSVRFIAAARKGDTLRVATEWGGFTLRPQIDAFVLDGTGKILSDTNNIPMEH